MLKVTDLTGQVVPVVNIQQVNRKRKVNGDKELTFVAIPDKDRPETFAALDNESKAEFLSDVYIIKTTSEKSVGDTSIKTLQALNEFTDVMINRVQYDLFSGSQTFFAALTRVFEPTPYDFSIVDSFYAEEFENFGQENCLAMFEQVLERYESEFRIIGNRVYLERKIGNDTGIQFRWAHNVKAIDKQTDTKSLATVITGYGGKPSEAGVYPLVLTHRSDNAAIFGEKHAEPVFSESTSTITGMQARLERDLVDEPQLSITVDITALGLENGQLNEGDRVFVVYEPMGITVEARVVELDEVFHNIGGDWILISTAVTLSNIRNKLSDITTRFTQTTKRVDRLFEGREQLPYNVLPEAIRLAAEAINNSLTEIQYPPGEGIVLVDPNNPMNKVRLTSAGIGLSIDGGITYRSALTGAGIVTNELVAGIIRTNNIQIVGETDLFYWNGEGLFAYNPSDLTKFVRLNSSGLYISKGAITIERPDGYANIQNGLSSADYAITGSIPPYKSTEIEISGVFMRTRSTAPVSMEFISFKHESRYLKIRVAMFSELEGRHTTFRVDPVGGGASLASYNSLNADSQGQEANSGVTLTVDLGVPTGNTIQLYLRMNTGNATSWAHARVIRFWKEF